MYPSGVWDGFWQQQGYGRQPMAAFELHFRSGNISGRGTDIVGVFTFDGEYDENTGRVTMVKQYLGKHKVVYDGEPDGEGCIGGTWVIEQRWFGVECTGPFLMRPQMPKITGEEPIQEL